VTAEVADLSPTGRARAGRVALLRVLANLAPVEMRRVAARAADDAHGPGPLWLDLLDRVELVDGFTMTDPFGDQVNYVMGFAYRDGDRLVGQHGIIAMVDHNLHLLKDAMVAVDGADPLAAIRGMVDAEPDLQLGPFDPAVAANEIAAAMWLTEHTLDVGQLVGESTFDTWHLLASRASACLPEPVGPPDPDEAWPLAERAKVVTAFLRSTASREIVTGTGVPVGRAALRPLVSLFADWAIDYGQGRPTAWSPTAVMYFLTDFAPAKVLWEPDDIPLVAPALRAYVDWALRREGIPSTYREQAVAAVDDLADEFAEAAREGAAPDTAMSLMAALLSSAVDLTDPAAVKRFIDSNNPGPARG
jgi:hypothetical protein